MDTAEAYDKLWDFIWERSTDLHERTEYITFLCDLMNAINGTPHSLDCRCAECVKRLTDTGNV